MSKVLEVGMLVCFGFSWPFNLAKSIKTRSTQGKSLVFLWAITIGYLCGIGSKLVAGAPWNEYFFVYIVYVLNTVMVMADLVMYYINRAGEKKREKASA